NPGGYVPNGAGSLTGTYQWIATFSGDANNSTVSGNRGDEPEKVNPASPTISTSPGAAVVVGSGAALTDSASLSLGADFLSGDTITFKLYAPSDTNYASPVYTDVVSIA